MQGIFETAKAAFTLILLLLVGWTVVFIVGSIVERKLSGSKGRSNLWASFTWVWDNANLIGIPTLVVGSAYMIWAINSDVGLGGPTLLVLLLMGAAVMLIGFAPSLRRR